MDEPVARKAYYSIGDVCDLTGLKPHVLRYWETQFDLIKPTKNRAGNRVYRPKEVELILMVRHLLYEEKFTIEGARQKLHEMRRAGGLEEEQQEILEPEFLQGMKDELQQLVKVLSPKPSRLRPEDLQ
jgi:DNA-binding transcriptional MerR regulator